MNRVGQVQHLLSTHCIYKLLCRNDLIIKEAVRDESACGWESSRVSPQQREEKHAVNLSTQAEAKCQPSDSAAPRWAVPCLCTLDPLSSSADKCLRLTHSHPRFPFQMRGRLIMNSASSFWQIAVPIKPPTQAPKPTVCRGLRSSWSRVPVAAWAGHDLPSTQTQIPAWQPAVPD